MKKKSVSLARVFPVLLLCLLCLTPTAYANSGPRPEICITVVNAPEGEVCLALLMEGGQGVDPSETQFQYDPGTLANLRALEGGGWVLGDAFTAAYSAGRQKDGSWVFRRDGFSRPFRVAVATKDNAQAAETPYTPGSTFVNIVYDWETNTVRETTPPPLRFLARLASTLIPTLIIEGLVFWLFGFRQRRSWLVFLAVNVATQTVMHLIFAWNIPIAGSHPLYYALLFVPSEVVICMVESAAYALLLTEHDRPRRVKYAVLANITSAVLGYFPLHLLYEFLVRM